MYVADFYQGNRAMVRLDGITCEYPFESISIYICSDESPSPFNLALFSVPPQYATDPPIWAEDSLLASLVPAYEGWHDFPIRRRLTVGDTVYIQLSWLPDTPTDPRIGVNYIATDNNSFNGLIEGDLINWKPHYGNAYLMRLNQSLPDTLPDFPPQLYMPDSFAIFLDIDSSLCRSKHTAYQVIRDSLHISVPVVEAGNHFLSVAAYHNNIIGPRSEPISFAQTGPLSFPLTLEPESLVVQTMEGELIDFRVGLANPSDIDLQFDFLLAEDYDWLSTCCDSGELAAGDQTFVTLTIDSRMISPGNHEAEATISCFASGFDFSSYPFRIYNHVDIGTGICEPGSEETGGDFILQNHPNPFNESTQILSSSSAPIYIYNILGELVTSLKPSSEQTDGYVFIWNGTDTDGRPVSSGLYIYRRQEGAASRKMLLLK
jgi:hypothetical protein